MTMPKPVLHSAHRLVFGSASVVAAAFLLASGVHGANASPAGSSSSENSASGSAGSGCPAQISVELGSITLSAGTVSVNFSHNGHNCPSARPAEMHLHQNLVSSPQAGSDPVHQWNKDLLIGASFGNEVSFPLLQAADGKCFVQVDVKVTGSAPHGKFFPTTTCPSPVETSVAPSSTAHTSTPPSTSSASSSSASSSSATTSTAASSTAASSSSSSVPSSAQTSVLPESASRSSAEQSVVPVAQQSSSSSTGSLASTGTRTAVPVGLAALLICAGAWLMKSAARRPRRH